MSIIAVGVCVWIIAIGVCMCMCVDHSDRCMCMCSMLCSCTANTERSCNSLLTITRSPCYMKCSSAIASLDIRTTYVHN